MWWEYNNPPADSSGSSYAIDGSSATKQYMSVYSNDTDLKDLLYQIENGKIQLPDFQREGQAESTVHLLKPRGWSVKISGV